MELLSLAWNYLGFTAPLLGLLAAFSAADALKKAVASVRLQEVRPGVRHG